MRFLVRKRRSTPAVIIVALIDVLIVLVIFLLVTTTFKQVPSLKLSLPESNHSLKPGATENPPLIVTIGPGNEGLRFGADDMPMTIEEVKAQLDAAVKKNPNASLAVRADTNAPWGTIVKVMDAAKGANIKVMSAYTKEAGKQ